MGRTKPDQTSEDIEVSGAKKPALRRLMFIDFRLKFAGSVQRALLQKQFGISPQQATKDLKAYLELAPANMEYSVWEKAYVATGKFKSAFPGSSIKRYLRRLVLLANGSVRERNWVGDKIDVAVATTPMRLPDAKILKSILEAINGKKVLEVTYVSMSSGRDDRREIAPHALCSDGKRWHTRAWDLEKAEYRDFVIGRILSSKVLTEVEEEIPLDDDWVTTCEIVVSPAASLSKEASDVIAAEYLMKDRKLVIETSKAMLFYALRELGFNPRDTEKDGIMRNISFLNLEVENLDEVEKNLERRPSKS